MDSNNNHTFTLASISLLESNPVKTVTGPLPAVFRSPELQFFLEPDGGQHSIIFDIRITQLYRLSEVQSLCVSEGSESTKEKTYSKGITIQFKDEEESSSFHGAFEQWKKEVVIQVAFFQLGFITERLLAERSNEHKY
ncbi:protein arginine methyltransferase 4A [Artemisia annua]|uniref:Protein arginine methyltransferase 4A n=1 Tax=Artemisia annua TaxID=35608 RepID=A0A2U1L5E2_ARTAN|nr:protein arginine methyltransferase 4A [Artemisia annua]